MSHSSLVLPAQLKCQPSCGLQVIRRSLNGTDLIAAQRDYIKQQDFGQKVRSQD